MKRVSWTTIIIVVIVALLLPYFVKYHIRDLSKNQYTLLRLNPESNIRGDDEKYIFRQGKKIRCYSLKTKELKEYDINKPEE